MGYLCYNIVITKLLSIRELMTRYAKIFLLIAVLIGLGPLFPNSAKGANGVIFEYPVTDQVLNKDDRENIRGYFTVSPDEITKAEISFDGFVWRELKIDSNYTDGYYHFNYGWMVAGKGKFFIIVKATTANGNIIEDRLRVEVNIPPGREDPSIRKLLDDIYFEQERRQQASLEPDPAPTLLGIAANFIEKDLGNFIAKNYLMFLPTKTQFNIILTIFGGIINFIKNYQAGVDILMFLIHPYLLIMTFLLGWLFIVGNIVTFYDSINWLIYRIGDRERANFFGTVFDLNDLHKVSLAKVSLKNNQTGLTKNVMTNPEGQFETNLPAGVYSYEIEKRNYRNYTDASERIDSFLSIPVAKGEMTVNGDSHYALPTESLLSFTRWNLHLKGNWTYWINSAVINNITALVSTSYLAITIWLIFVEDYRVWIYLGVITVAYLFYFFLVRTSHDNGMVYGPDGEKTAMINLIIEQNGRDALSIWTDYEGRFTFGQLPDGQYTIRVNDDIFEMDEKKEYYNGQNFVVDRNNSCVLPIIIKLKKITR